MTAEIVHGDMRTLLPEWSKDGVRFDAVICDPPYHIESIAKRFKKGAAPAKDARANRLSRRFTGSETDTGDVSFQKETWESCAAVLNPGGRLAAFGGPRNFWKTAAAIDAAQFEIEDTLMWVYGSGMVLRQTRMKPAYEPIILARKPGPVQKLNIDECRGKDDRWPTNLILSNGMQHVIDHTEYFTRCAVTPNDLVMYYKKAAREERVLYCPECHVAVLPSEREAHAHGQLSGHPTVKPVALLEHLIKLLVPPGGLVLDPFGGTGTTAVAGVNCGRNVVCIEKELQHVQGAKRRIGVVA